MVTYNSTESLVKLLLEFRSNAAEDIQYSIENDSKEALDNIIGVLQAHSTEASQLDAIEISDIANMGMQLFEHLNYKVQRNPEYIRSLNNIVLSFSFWVAANKGVIPHLDFVLNTLALVSNETDNNDKATLKSLCEVVAYVVEAIPEDNKDSASALRAGDPWRVVSNKLLHYCD